MWPLRAAWQIAAKLAELIPLKKRLQPELIAETKEDVLRRIFAHVRTKTGHDFSKYKRSTLSRRLTRRMR